MKSINDDDDDDDDENACVLCHHQALGPQLLKPKICYYPGARRNDLPKSVCRDSLTSSNASLEGSDLQTCA
jgi:hypothetical protein